MTQMRPGSGAESSLMATDSKDDMELASTGTSADKAGKVVKAEKPPASSGKSEDVRVCGIQMKWLSLVALTFQTTWQAFVIKFAHAGKTKYLNSTAILFAELLKIVICLLMEGYFTGSLTNVVFSLIALFRTRPMEAVKFGVPALLYMVQNNLIFYSLEKLSMAVQQVTYQLKILTAAFLSVIFLGKKVTQIQWIALMGLIIGVVLVQLPEDLQFRIPDFSEEDMGLTDDGDGIGMDALLGFGAVLSACFFSGCAGVYMEKMLKQSDQSLWFKNVLLGIFGALSALFGSLYQDGSAIMSDGFTQGYTWRVWLVIWTLATGGLMAAVVIKYADNILRQFSTAISILITMFISSVILQEIELGPIFFLGASLAIGATFMYNLGLPERLMRILEGRPSLPPAQQQQ
mmetsp:Transcript_69497/g.166586  ORF Transcript_69497/g.166586 Transcript_69497/m.166586 type:complete len:403 (+) Transcript_69497:109-1317(+)|eukprot:CAMPEP_0178390066 /NCGR_PEP_ID=MMETSP0689_2-20121128/10452_1 /TAXON_ID=160604 /ORGANISM="Amphidinium massartii, Strain CS-259" /LENGTH=402 /DNA_ID=CAMNT_0020010559 /DNA_START=94 /DNA_END=1302 /DNA_ORIENTATION=-